ncbi:Uncharacterised protein [Candidatus Burarchaeum australiense]|nr:Uncharacterised protein [Candidatus Burarchaeum australiense]
MAVNVAVMERTAVKGDGKGAQTAQMGQRFFNAQDGQHWLSGKRDVTCGNWTISYEAYTNTVEFWKGSGKEKNQTVCKRTGQKDDWIRYVLPNEQNMTVEVLVSHPKNGDRDFRGGLLLVYSLNHGEPKLWHTHKIRNWHTKIRQMERVAAMIPAVMEAARDGDLALMMFTGAFR